MEMDTKTLVAREREKRERERIFKGTKAPNGRWLAHQPDYPGNAIGEAPTYVRTCTL